MSRRRQLVSIKAGNIRLERAEPGSYKWYFRGYRQIPEALFTVSRLPGSKQHWVIRSKGVEKHVSSLKEARERLADLYAKAFH